MIEYGVYKIKDDRIDGPPTIIKAATDPAAIDQAKKLGDG
jgi:hypothetical protein